jgi:CxxC motif-containing protein (DUF1111 family)
MRRNDFINLTSVSTIAIALGAAFIAAPHAAFGQAASGVVDPGVRGGAAGAGGPLPGLQNTTAVPELTMFFDARERFGEIDSVIVGGVDIDAQPGRETGGGLGPAFNGNSCELCHIQPAVGGTGPATNPQIALTTLDGAKNTVPPFITANGPTREARFIKTANGTPDGGVHDLFSIAGRSDATGCNYNQPNFPQQLAINNVIFRIPTPLFGLGLIENTPDVNLKTDSTNVSGPQAALGIASGVFNISGNDGTITRFGWKAQNKSLLLFAGEAYNVEMGVSNEMFPNERIDQAGCQINATPEDSSNFVDTGSENFPASDFESDITDFAIFMRLAGPPIPVALNNTTTQGKNQFVNVGCADCHIIGHTTAASPFSNQSFVSFQPFSDIALHDMGSGLQDQVSQGNANGTQFRTAPLWGVGQRIFFLHDGRTTSLVTAIEAHSSTGSEANEVIANFNKLSAFDQQAVVDFLRSL